MTKSAPSPCNYVSLTAELFCWWRLKLYMYTLRYIPYMEGYIGFFLVQKKIPNIIFQLYTHCHILELALDSTWGGKKMTRNLFLKELKAEFHPKIAIYWQNLVPNSGKFKFPCQPCLQNCITG